MLVVLVSLTSIPTVFQIKTAQANPVQTSTERTPKKMNAVGVKKKDKSSFCAAEHPEMVRPFHWKTWIRCAWKKHTESSSYMEWFDSPYYPGKLLDAIMAEQVFVSNDNPSIGDSHSKTKNDPSPSSVRPWSSDEFCAVLNEYGLAQDDLAKNSRSRDVTRARESRVRLFETSFEQEKYTKPFQKCLEVWIPIWNDALALKMSFYRNEFNALSEREDAPKPLEPTEVKLLDWENGFKFPYAKNNPWIKDGEVMLTFDDGPHPKNTPELLKLLQEHNTKAMFFMLGSHVLEYPEVVRQVSENGHSAANHSVHHYNMRNPKEVPFPENGMLEFQSTHAAIFNVLNTVDPFYRYPYGNSVPAISNFLQANGMIEFYWDVDSNDWRMNLSDKEVLQSVLDQLKRTKKGVLLFHDVHRRTINVIASLLLEMRKLNLKTFLVQPRKTELQTDPPLLKQQIIVPVSLDTAK